MKQDRPFQIAMKIVGMRGDTEAYRDAVASIARAIRAEVKRAVKPFRDAIEACDFSYGRAQSDEVRDKIQAAIDRNPFSG
jgi:predicted phage gp36 major capsid-like protein